MDVLSVVILALVVVALVCFFLEMLRVAIRYNLVAGGLFCLTLALLLSDTVFKLELG